VSENLVSIEGCPNEAEEQLMSVKLNHISQKYGDSDGVLIMIHPLRYCTYSGKGRPIQVQKCGGFRKMVRVFPE